MTIMSRKAAEFWWNLPMKGVKRPKFVCPPEVSYFTRDEWNQKWIPTTWKEVFARRKEKQESRIRNKIGRIAELKPCYIWVFHNDTFLFGGWWIYVKTLKKDVALNFRQMDRYNELIRKIMDMFPCGVIPFDFNTWAAAFERTYHKDFKDKRRAKNALLLCRCLIDERGDIADIYPLNKKPVYGTSPI